MAEDKQLIQDLCDLEVPNAISISPDGRKIVYSTQLTWGHHKGKTAVSTLWLADTNVTHSSRQLTSGTFNDHAPCWSPNGESIAFISDRAQAGEKWAIYSMKPEEGGDPTPITSESKESSIESFAFSPDGKFIAYISTDEETEEQKAREERGEDFKVWGEGWVYNRLRIVDVATKEVQSLDIDRNVLSCCWNTSGTAIAIVTCRLPDFQDQLLTGTSISLVHPTHMTVAREIVNSRGSIDSIGWAGDGNIYFCTDLPIDKTQCGHAVYVADAASGEYHRVAFGIDDDGIPLTVDRHGEVVVYVEHRLESRLCRLDGTVIYGREEALEAFAVVSAHNGNEAIIAVATSKLNEPPEVYNITARNEMIQLSNHGKAFGSRKFGKCNILRCPSADKSVELDALYLTPTSHLSETNGAHSRPAPTVVLIHGGPNIRETNAFSPLYFMWTPYLLSKGYGVLIPNYRGSSGRGEKFAATSIDGGGVVDYGDIVASTQYAIEQGFVDKDKLIVGGWSNGGYLTLACSVRNGVHAYDWNFKAAIAGACISDSNSMDLTSDLGCVYQPEMNNGRVTWNMDRDDIRNRNRSPLWEVKAAVERGKKAGHASIPPILFLHGENDRRCHVSQAEGMRRALEYWDLPYEYVVYPRQGHFPDEQKCWIDMALRVGRWCDKYIGPESGNS